MGFRGGTATDSLISGRGLAVFALIRVLLFVTAFTGKILIFSFIHTNRDSSFNERTQYQNTRRNAHRAVPGDDE